MLKNRSVPADIILPHVTYHDLAAAIDWLKRVFGFTEHYRYGGDPVQGAQLHLGEAWIMVNRSRPGRSSLTIFVEDVDAHFEKTKSEGAKIVENLHETEYGERQYGVEDIEGHHWLFSRHARDVSPEEWGASVSDTPDTRR
jgi:uncharacterized glyoxalase superfamily protein PhnB